MSRRAVTATEVAEWIKAYEAGDSLRVIAERADRQHKIVRYHLARNNVPIRTHGEYVRIVPVNKPRPRIVDWCNECCEIRPLNHRTGWCQPCTDLANARARTPHRPAPSVADSEA